MVPQQTLKGERFVPPAAPGKLPLDSPVFFFLYRPSKLLQVAKVNEAGFAPLIMEDLGDAGKSRESPILLRFGKPSLTRAAQR